MPNSKEIYDLPSNVLFCKSCTMSNQRPRIRFNSDGVCNACVFQSQKRELVDWEERESQLLKLLDEHRDGPGEFDVVVPCSGGKDGGFVAHQLKSKYGMRVIAATWSPLVYTDIGRQNLDNFVKAGFDHVLGTPNPETTRRLVKLSFSEIGDPFQPFIYGQTNFPLSIAQKYGATLVMYGENGEVEYGGDHSGAESPVKKIDNEERHYFSGKPLKYWLDSGFSEAELSFFNRPTNLSKNLTQHFFGYYKKWDPQENYHYASEHLGFQASPLRSEGTYSRYASLDDRFDGFHYYLSFIKFGLGRASSDSAHEIRDGKITREEGVELVRQFDGEFPKKHFDEFLEYTGLSPELFNSIIDSWRSDHLWDYSNGEWKLRNTVWNQKRQ